MKIGIVNQKGGVGKTVTTLNLSHGLALKGNKVLMIDWDSGRSLTATLIRDPIERSVYDLIHGEGSPQDYIIELEGKPNLHLLPSDSRLARIEAEGGDQGELLLKKAMSGLRGFDFIILDSGPHLGPLTTSALAYVESVIIPISTDYLSLQGLVKINDLIEIVQEDLNPKLEILGYLPCQFDERRLLDREVLSSLKGKFQNVFKPIRQNISISESVSWGLSVQQYRKNSRGAEDYGRLVNSVIKLSKQ